ncbi:hypothetical protein [Streptomyces sp. NPDC057287]|uniref:hypothetical protein n=1 Tax=Streptomyces sp. NPDC057287 TaxID=3346086 RepID=UPI003632275A
MPDTRDSPRTAPDADAPPSRRPAHLLVVGATGALLPAVRAATALGDTVTALARTATALRDLERRTGGRSRPLPRDYRAPGLREDLARASREIPFTGALLYCPLATPSTVRALTAAVPPDRPVVLLLTSAHAAPDSGAADGLPWSPARLPPAARPTPGCRLLVLGWRTEPDGARWHTPEEISGAALRVLDAAPAGDAVLGCVRPWSSRPR